jgi:hypothetical protein
MYAVEMGSGAMIYIPSFIKIGSDIQKLIRRIHNWLRHYATGRKVAGSSPEEVDIFQLT